MLEDFPTDDEIEIGSSRKSRQGIEHFDVAVGLASQRLGRFKAAEVVRRRQPERCLKQP